MKNSLALIMFVLTTMAGCLQQYECEVHMADGSRQTAVSYDSPQISRAGDLKLRGSAFAAGTWTSVDCETVVVHALPGR